MSTDYVFFVCSTLNSSYGQLDESKRTFDTFNCIGSIKDRVPDARILVVDNSSIEPHPGNVADIKKIVTEYVQIRHNLFSLNANRHKLKSASECNLMWEALDILAQRYSDCKRIFKISGRYKLNDDFNINFYDDQDLKGKYVFVPMEFKSTYDDWQTERRIMRLETGLVSWCPSLTTEFKNMMGSVMWQCLTNDNCIEEALFNHIPHSKIRPKVCVGVEGTKSDTGELVKY